MRAHALVETQLLGTRPPGCLSPFVLPTLVCPQHNRIMILRNRTYAFCDLDIHGQTHVHALSTHVVLPAGIDGQRYPSMAKCEQITCLDKQFLVGGPLGQAVPDGLLVEVVRAIRRAVGEVLL